MLAVLLTALTRVLLTALAGLLVLLAWLLLATTLLAAALPALTGLLILLTALIILVLVRICHDEEFSLVVRGSDGPQRSIDSSSHRSSLKSKRG
ncbi:MAG TPA: hypothetical protein VJT13_14335 [Xanthobacteraceae bacterium]|nr:hypothetical protein [Xanthobacteraceae bacterium]